MTPAELLLRYQHEDERAHALEAEIERLGRRQESDEEVERLVLLVEEAREQQQSAARRLRDVEMEVEGHRAKMKSREKELMSGRVRNPTELIQMSEEVDHAKARLREEEDAELEVMADAEAADEQLSQLSAALLRAREAWEASLPGVRARIQAAERELEAATAERDGVWLQVPPEYQAEYRRLSRLPSPVAEVSRGQCGHCRVGLTASELQQVRRGDHMVHCQSCSRLLVMV